MILVTVGTQLPFDRLIGIVDRAAADLGEPVVAQTGRSALVTHNVDVRDNVDPVEFETLLKEARVIVAHAGIGTMLMAQKLGRPLILFPRSAALGEHRNDHQLATAAALEGRAGIYVARTEEELLPLLSRPLDPPGPTASNANLDRLNSALVDYIAAG